MNELTPSPRKPRRVGCLTSIVFLLIGGAIFYVVVQAVFSPWIYRVGGRFRLWPVWEGVGVAHAASGNYTFHIWFTPAPSRSRTTVSTSVEGHGYLCTPRGERYALRVRGGTPGRIWLDMDGQPFRLRAYARSTFWGFSAQTYQPPRLTFAGQWSGDELVMTDEGSFDRAFEKDGSLIAHPTGRRVTGGGLPVTFTETAWWFRPSCPAPGG
jgi:hypothetical protein